MVGRKEGYEKEPAKGSLSVLSAEVGKAILDAASVERRATSGHSIDDDANWILPLQFRFDELHLSPLAMHLSYQVFYEGNIA